MGNEYGRGMHLHHKEDDNFLSHTSRMEKFRRSFIARRRKSFSMSNKAHQWQEDENDVRNGKCKFLVKYLGFIEVCDSRGMPMCEHAIQTLLAQKSKHRRSILHVSGDALRVIDEQNKTLLVDQTIEKVSFCAPGSHNDKGFAYICRDGTSRAWLCHAFVAIQSSGERLSHAVGSAFHVCLERKLKRERDLNNTANNKNENAFSRIGSFRSASILQRMLDPQSVIVADPIPSLKQPKCAYRARPRPKTRSGSVSCQDLENSSYPVSTSSGDNHDFDNQTNADDYDLFNDCDGLQQTANQSSVNCKETTDDVFECKYSMSERIPSTCDENVAGRNRIGEPSVIYNKAFQHGGCNKEDSIKDLFDMAFYNNLHCLSRKGNPFANPVDLKSEKKSSDMNCFKQTINGKTNTVVSTNPFRI